MILTTAILVAIGETRQYQKLKVISVDWMLSFANNLPRVKLSCTQYALISVELLLFFFAGGLSQQKFAQNLFSDQYRQRFFYRIVNVSFSNMKLSRSSSAVPCIQNTFKGCIEWH